MIRLPEHADYMLYPRLLAAAERSWHTAKWETIVDQQQFERARRHDWSHFASAVGHRELRRLDQLRVQYRLPLPGVR